MKNINLAIFPADGIGPEVIASSQQVLHKLEQLHGGVHFESRTFDWSSAYYQKNGSMMPADGLEQLEAGGFDAILMGPVGSPTIPDHITLWGLLLTIRQGFDQYVNLRPMRQLAGVASPLRNQAEHSLNMVCVRENSEGEYAGVGGRVHQGKAREVAIQSTVFTRNVTERVMRFAFDYAQQHGHRLVTNVTKSNSMQYKYGVLG